MLFYPRRRRQKVKKNIFDINFYKKRGKNKNNINLIKQKKVFIQVKISYSKRERNDDDEKLYFQSEEEKKALCSAPNIILIYIQFT